MESLEAPFVINGSVKVANVHLKYVEEISNPSVCLTLLYKATVDFEVAHLSIRTMVRRLPIQKHPAL